MKPPQSQIKEGITILLIDDDSEDHLLFKAYLSNAPLKIKEIISEYSVKDGLARFSEGQFDICFLDNNLGDSDGLSFLAAVESIPVIKPIVMLTGSNDFSVDVKASQLGASDFLVKSEYTSNSLERSIRYAMERHKQNLQLQIYSETVNNVDACLILTDTNERIEWVNPYFLQLTGFTKEEVQYKKPSELLQRQETSLETRQAIRQAINQRESVTVEILNFKKNGEEYWNHLTITPLFNTKGVVTNFLSVGIDITEEVRLREEILAQKIKAEQQEQAKSTFISMISHEIRTPLQSIFQLIELIKEDEDVDRENLEKGLDLIDLAGKQLLGIVNDVLDLARIESGEMTIENVEFSLTELLNGVCDLLKPKAELRKIDLSLNLHNEVPYVLSGDPLRIRQILINLLSNAIKFTKKGSVSVDLYCAISNERTDILEITLSVIDTGIGIPKEKHEEIFLPYKQSNASDARLHGGTGLGLSICKKLISLMGGTISIDSTYTEGTKMDCSFSLSILEELHSTNVELCPNI